MRFVPVLLSIAFLAACASTPAPSSGPAPAAAPAAPAPVAAPKAAPAPAANPVATPAASTAAAKSEEKAPRGYRLQKKDGKTFYCKRTKVLGSNIERNVCLTPQEYEIAEAAAEAQREELRRRGNMCANPGGACGG